MTPSSGDGPMSPTAAPQPHKRGPASVPRLSSWRGRPVLRRPKDLPMKGGPGAFRRLSCGRTGHHPRLSGCPVADKVTACSLRSATLVSGGGAASPLVTPSQPRGSLTHGSNPAALPGHRPRRRPHCCSTASSTTVRSPVVVLGLVHDGNTTPDISQPHPLWRARCPCRRWSPSHATVLLTVLTGSSEPAPV